MWQKIVYGKPGKRRPIRVCGALLGRDPQAEIPWGWCIRCGSEVFVPGQPLCSSCRERGQRNE